MAAVDDGDLWSGFLNERDETGHLRVVNDDDVCAAGSEGPTGGQPAAFGVGEDPFVDLGDLRLGEADVWGCDALEDVVICFCDAEHTGVWLGDVPTGAG